MPVVRRDHRQEQRIRIVLLAEDQPHIDPGGVHRGGKDGVEPAAHHLGDERRLLTERQDLRAIADPHAGDVGDLPGHDENCQR